MDADPGTTEGDELELLVTLVELYEKVAHPIDLPDLISVKEVLLNLPEWPNIMRDLLMAHRVNAESVGDIAAVKKLIRAELNASKEHLRRARERREGYYSKKYSGLKSQAKLQYNEVCCSWLKIHKWSSRVIAHLSENYHGCI